MVRYITLMKLHMGLALNTMMKSGMMTKLVTMW